MPDNPSVAALNDDEDSFFGCTFPLTYGVGGEGFFPRSRTLKEQASSNIKNLLLTMKGERVSQPEFGSDLPAIIFEPIDGTIGEKIDNAIREALAIWLPYITAENIFTLQDESNPNQVTVSLEFRVDTDDPDALETMTFNFNTGG
jgi:hypothetical protein